MLEHYDHGVQRAAMHVLATRFRGEDTALQQVQAGTGGRFYNELAKVV